jgi:type IV secretion system protein VirB1
MDYSQAIAYWTSLCLSCAPNVNPATTAAIITIESKGNPFAIGDNTTHKSYTPKSREAAVNIAQSLLNQKHSIDIGLMQINSIHIKPMRLNLNDLFDSCYNISVGSRILTDFYVKHAKTSSNQQETLMKAISSYNTGHPYKGYYNGYVQKMLKSVNYAYDGTRSNTSYKSSKVSKSSKTPKSSKSSKSIPESKTETLLVSSNLENPETLQESQEKPVTSFFIQKRNKL